ncbi:MAG TPA: hypothetical protein VMZ29_06145 [Candidatus Bathyarchaeia archaeon]|nr:hypothetical protein [Candidatus Bathyarchaeia archaeon]
MKITRIIPLVVSVYLTIFVLMVSQAQIQSYTEQGNSSLEGNDYSVPSVGLILTEYVIPTLPGGPAPNWNLSITGIGLTEAVQLNLTYLIDEINAGNLPAYEQVAEYSGANQTLIGIDILTLVQNYANVWYAGEFTFIAEDDYSVAINATDIVYSMFPPVLESADIKILLAFAVNGSYLQDSDWAHKGGLRLAPPSNLEHQYFKSAWVGNVTEISISDRWKCHVYVDGQLETSISIGDESSYTDIDYLTYNLTYKFENTKFAGPSVTSILFSIGVSLDEISLIQAEAPDAIALVNATEFGGIKPAILCQAINDEYIGFNKGPFRLVGGDLSSFHWIKNCFALHITTMQLTSSVPGFCIVATIGALVSMPIVNTIIKKRN